MGELERETVEGYVEKALEGGSFTRDFGRLMKGALEMERLHLRELCEANLERDSFTGDPKGYAK